MKRSLLSIFIIVVLALSGIGLSSAFFSDTETSSDNILQAGDIDLTINDQNDPEGIVFFEDLKPGDNYVEEKEVRVGSNPAWVWFHIYGVETEQGLQTEPEEVEENGIEKHDLNNYLTYDLAVNDEVLIAGESGIAFNDVVSCWVPLGELPGDSIVSVFQSFHLPSSVTNWAQGDRMTFSEEWYAEQSRNNPNPSGPVSETGRVWDTELGHCKDCTPGQVFASSVAASAQGLRNNGSAVLPERSSAGDVTGAPDGIGSPASGFYSLGFGGSITIEFGTAVQDVVGDDLVIHEITNGPASYPEEKATVEVSGDGVTWFTLSEVASSKKNEGGASKTRLDISETGLSEINFVRITDTTVSGIHNGVADGFDLDAVEGIEGTCVEDQ